MTFHGTESQVENLYHDITTFLNLSPGTSELPSPIGTFQALSLISGAINHSLLCGTLLPLALGNRALLTLFIIERPTILVSPGLRGFC